MQKLNFQDNKELDFKQVYIRVLELLKERQEHNMGLFICNIIKEGFSLRQGLIILEHFKETLPKVMDESDYNDLNCMVICKEDLIKDLKIPYRPIWSPFAFNCRETILEKLIQFCDENK